MMQPSLIIHYPAIILAAVAYFVLGWLWYSPLLFGNIWTREMKFPPDFRPDAKGMAKSMGMLFIGNLVTSYVLTHSVQVWMPSVWNIPGSDAPVYTYGLMAGIFTWLGYYLPVYLSTVAFEGRSWLLFFINSGYHLVSLLIVTQILVHWR